MAQSSNHQLKKHNLPLSPNLKCSLSEWGLPPLIINWYKKKGISSLFEWQVECLCKNDVLFGGNLVYSAPTSAGKTLVADFLLLKRVLEYNKKALIIEPFVALTREKATTLKSMLYTTKARVGAFGGNYYTPGGMAAVSVAVCTIEKANNFMNKLINENKLGDLGIVVVDEIHYLGDESRGYQLELLLTKIMYYNKSQEKDKKIQIVGLSATIPNLESIAVWLNASLYVTDYRPVPLVEKIKIDNKIFDATSYLQNPLCEPLEIIQRGKYSIAKDYDDICHICLESIIDGFSTLIFCHKKKDCELLAIHLASQIKISGSKVNSDNNKQAELAKQLRESLSGPKLRDVLEKLKKCPAGTDKDLEISLKLGVAFHHAGLTSEEREIIEDGFKGGAVKVLLATSTLSSGVNLPARKVIIHNPTKTFYSNGKAVTEMLDPTSYRQMIGRAGRKNMDTFGESILMCTPDNYEFGIRLLKASLGDINSSLGYRMMAEGEPSGLKKAVLEVIANNTAKTKASLDQYLKTTFWLSCLTSKQDKEVKDAINKTIQFLVQKKFIEELKPGVFRSTRLGNAVLASGLHPDDSLELLQDLTIARKGFCLLNDLHIIYQVTPIDIPRDITLNDWQHYSKVWNSLDDISQSVGQLVGISENTIIRCVQGYTASFTEQKARIYRRFWVALIINDLINEIPLPEICEKYRANKSVVQQTQRAVAQFAGVMSIFCEELGYGNIAALMTPLESRINFSCQRDLLDLIRLNITRPIARALFNSGYRNVINVAKADKFDIEFIIRQTKPFKKDASFNHQTDKTPYLWVPELAMNMTTLDYASHIVDSARSYVEIEYDIDLSATIAPRRNDEGQYGINSSNDKNNINALDLEQPLKRGRLENGMEKQVLIRYC